MDVHEKAKYFKIENWFLIKNWIRYIENREEESSFNNENRDYSPFL